MIPPMIKTFQSIECVESIISWLYLLSSLIISLYTAKKKEMYYKRFVKAWKETKRATEVNESILSCCCCYKTKENELDDGSRKNGAEVSGFRL